MPLSSCEEDLLEMLVARRNSLQLRAENLDPGAELGEICWTRLGVANRHIERAVSGVLTLFPAVEKEITDCFGRVDLWLTDKERGL